MIGKRCRFLTTAVLALGLVAGIHTGALGGYSQGGAFKGFGYGARVWGMGGAGVASVSDESAVYWNPAMLSLLPANTAGASYINLVSGTTARLSQIAYGHVLQANEPDDAGGPLARHAVGAMYTNLMLDIQGGDGYTENVLRVAYAYGPDYFVSFGVAGEVFISSSDVPGFGAAGTSVDASVRLALLEDFTLGFIARNAFSRYSYDDGSDYTREREYVVGVSTTAVPQATLEGDVVFSHGDMSRIIAGGETDYFFDHLALRAGFAVINAGVSRNVPYLGFGVKLDRFKLHYNANLDDETAFEDTHRFTLSLAI